MSCGIYCIENKANGKKYVGKSIDIKKRWNNHIAQLRNNSHPNEYLQRSWNKYGEEMFDFCVLEVCESEILNDREKYWIDYYDSFLNGYNLTLGGDGGNTISKYTEAQLEAYKAKKKSIHSKTALKGEETSASKLNNSQVVEIIDMLLSGGYIVDIAKKYNVSCSTIYDIRVHNTWNSLTKDIVFPHTSKRCLKGIKGKAVAQYDLFGNYIDTYISAREAEKITGCSYKHISSVCNGKRKTCGGYLWRFVESGNSDIENNCLSVNSYVEVQNSKSVAYISDCGGIIKAFPTITEAARFYNISIRGVSDVCKGKISQTHGMRFRFLKREELYELYQIELNRKG